MASSRNARTLVAALALSGLALASPRAASAPRSVSIVGGADDPVLVDNGARKDRYFRLGPAGQGLAVRAEGPVVLSVRVRAPGAAAARAVLRIERNDGPPSDNALELEPSPGASVDDGPVSEERNFHLQLPAGEHRLVFRALSGGALVLKVAKTTKYDPELAPAAERAPRRSGPEPARAAAAKPAPEPARPAPAAAKAPAPRPAPPAAPAPPPDDAEDPPDDPPVAPLPTSSVAFRALPIAGPAGITEITVAPVRAEQRPAPPAGGARITSPGMLPTAPPRPPEREGGLALALRGGGQLFTGRAPGLDRSAKKLVAGRVWALPVALELAWDIDLAWSLFVEGEFWRAATQHGYPVPDGAPGEQGIADALVSVLPAGSAGVSVRVPFGPRAGMSVRAGGTGARVEALATLTEGGAATVQPMRAGAAWGALAGLSLDVAAGPGRLVLEGRYRWLWVDPGVRAPPPGEPADGERHDYAAVQALAGYRLEL